MPNPRTNLSRELGKELGSGHFAKVRLGTNTTTGQVAAVKIIKKPKGAAPSGAGISRVRRVACSRHYAEIERRALTVAGSKMAIIKSEVDILKSVQHPYIVQCFDAVDSPDKMYLVMEMCDATHTSAACEAPEHVRVAAA